MFLFFFFNIYLIILDLKFNNENEFGSERKTSNEENNTIEKINNPNININVNNNNSNLPNNNNTKNNFNFFPRENYIKNRIIENISESKYSNMNKFPVFDFQRVFKMPNSDNKNFSLNNPEYSNLMENNYKNIRDSKNFFPQNSINYGYYNNYQNNFSNLNVNQIELNLMKKHFGNLNINAPNVNESQNITNKTPYPNEFKLYQSLMYNNAYSMMMIQNNNKLRGNNFENLSKNEENSDIATKTKNSNKKNAKSDSKKIKKPFIEREGDWLCFQCKNLNFSFRISCNRCQISKEENETLKSKQTNVDDKTSK